MQARWWLLYAKNTLHVLNVYIFRFSSLIEGRRPCLTWVRLPVTTRVQFSREAVKLWVNSKADRALVSERNWEKWGRELASTTAHSLCASQKRRQCEREGQLSWCFCTTCSWELTKVDTVRCDYFCWFIFQYGMLLT